MSQLWFSKSVFTDNKSIFVSNMSNKGVKHVGQLSKTNGKVKSQEEITTEFSLEKNIFLGCNLLML